MEILMDTPHHTPIVTLADVAAQLDHVGLQFMATLGLDGRPKVRPMQYMVLHDDKLWFCTNRKKDIYAELHANPALELCGSRLQDNEIDTAWIRISAEAVFDDNPLVRRLIVDKSPIVHQLYAHNPDHPLFRVFYLKNIEGVMTNLGHVRGLSEDNTFAPSVTFKF